jgi:hypothetical protein
MRVNVVELGQIAGVREGFLSADKVLLNILTGFANGCVGEEEFLSALLQHHAAYEGYVKRLYGCLSPVPEA